MGLISRFWKSIATGYKLFLGITEILRITYTGGNVTWIEGGAIAGNKLVIKANSTDDTRFQCNGGGAIEVYATSLKCLATGGLEMITSGDITTIGAIDLALATAAGENQDISLTPSGTGRVKFGTYAAGAASDSIGYISIKDAAGNTRKLMVQA